MSMVRNGSGTGRLAALALALPLLAGATGPSGDLEVAVEKLRSQRGMIRLCLTQDPAHFPDCDGDPAARRLSVAAGRPSATFASLPSGTYALAVLHDENGNARLDTFAGIPREGIGFSGNPRIRFGPPSFASVRFRAEPAAMAQTVRMQYFF